MYLYYSRYLYIRVQLRLGQVLLRRMSYLVWFLKNVSCCVSCLMSPPMSGQDYYPMLPQHDVISKTIFVSTLICTFFIIHIHGFSFGLVGFVFGNVHVLHIRFQIVQNLCFFLCWFLCNFACPRLNSARSHSSKTFDSAFNLGTLQRLGLAVSRFPITNAAFADVG